MAEGRAADSEEISDALRTAAGLGEHRGGLMRAMIRWTRLLAAHRVILSVFLVVMGAAFSAMSSRIAWQADILQFFSADSADVRNLRTVGEQVGLANYLRFDVHLEASGGTTAAEDDQSLIACTHELAAELRATGEFRTVWTGPDTATMADAYGKLLAQAPAVLTNEERAVIESRATPEFLTKRFANVRAALADPDGEFLLRQLRNDPLDIAGLIAAKLQSLSPIGSDKSSAATMQDGVLLAREAAGGGGGGGHAMIVGEPISLPSNQRSAERTLAAVNNAIAKLKAAHHDIGVWVVGAHRGYVENARRIKSDVALVSILGTVWVGLAIAIYFRRVSTALLCIIPPSVGVGVALGLAGAFHVMLPLILLGFAGLLCGSTTDYGIQIIAECRRLTTLVGGGWDADIPAVAARRLFGPISMSVATSVTGFGALGLSNAPGLRALGLFVGAATICIWAITFLVLPAYLGPWILPKNRTSPVTDPVRNFSTKRVLFWIGGAAFLAMTLWLAAAALHVQFNTDPHGLDGSSSSLMADEQAFFRVWGEMRNRALVLVHGNSPAAALANLSTIDAYLRDQQRDGMIVHKTSPAAILPDDSTAETRAKEWAAYWTPPRQADLRAMLIAAAKTNGFKADAFSTYTDHIAQISLASAGERLAQSPAALLPGFISLPLSDSAHTTLAIIVDLRTDRSLRLATGWAQELRLRYPEVVILSGQMLLFDATERARAEAEQLAPWCLLAILAPLWIYFRRMGLAWLAMLCLVMGFVWVLGAAQHFAGGLNLLSLVPVLFTLGVAVDYGVYAASDPAWRQGGRDNRLSTTFLCALTTILGSGSLMIATHPALRWLGITLVAGVTGGYLTSLFIVAPVLRWRYRRRMEYRAKSRRRRAGRFAGRLVIGLYLALITLFLAIPCAVQIALQLQHPAGMAPISTPAHAKLLDARTYAFGKSWMRWRETSPQAGIWEIAAVGTPVERGTALAALASPIDVRIENEMLDQLDYFLPQEWSRWLVLRGVATNLVNLPGYVAPEYQREIFAAATSYTDPHAYLAPPYPRILSYHALHDISQMLIDNPLIVPNTFACTGVVSRPSYTASGMAGDLMLARVFDFEGGESFGRQKSITYIVPPPAEGIPFAHVAWPGLAGAVTGMNQEKLALFINAAATKDFRRIGTPTILMARDVLEHAHSIADADRIIRATQVFVSDIIVVADGKTGEARIFEKSPARTASYDVELSAVVTNHLITPTFSDDPVNRERQDEGTTMQRYARARQLLDKMAQHVTVERLADLLRDKRGSANEDLGYGNRNAIDGLIACHAVIMDVTRGEMWVAGWPNAEGAFVGVDVMAMLRHAGENASFHAQASPPGIPAATMMSDGTWERVVAARGAADQAEAALRDGNSMKAREFAETVVRNNPNFYLGHELLGRALFAGGDKERAKAELKMALTLDPPYSGRRAAIEGLIKKCDTH